MRNERVKVDGALNFFGGQDSRRNPADIDPNQVSFAVNCAFRGGYCDQRPAFHQRALTFPNEEALSWFQTRNLQAAIQYRDYVACVIAGRLFLIDVIAWRVLEITPTKRVAAQASFITPAQGSTVSVQIDPNPFTVGLPAYLRGDSYTVVSKTTNRIAIENVSGMAGVAIPSGEPIEALDLNLPNNPHAWLLDAEQYLIAQDGSSGAIIYDGESRRANPANYEVPTGTAMAYGNGRMWVAKNGNQFVAGDINFDTSTKIIRFKENTFIAGGGAFQLPGDSGNITAMVFMPQLNTALGHGQLHIGTETSMYSVNIPTSRDDWATTGNPIQTMSLRGFGPLSAKSISMVNGDLFYRSRDGIRSYAMAVREFGTWGNVPISAEMARVMENDPPNLLSQSSAVLFDNRLLFTTSLQPDGFGSYANALGALDFDPLSFQGRKSPPVWDGFWTGIDFRQLVSGNFGGMERCFAFVRDSNGLTRFWELLKAGDFDSGDCRIQSFFESKSHNFGSLFELKRLEDADIWFDKVRGDVDFDVKYRQDQSPCWKEWRQWTECQTGKDCHEGTCWTPAVQWPGYRTRRSLRRPAPVDDLGDLKPSDLGYEFQVRVEWIGRARIKRYLLVAQPEQEAITGRAG